MKITKPESIKEMIGQDRIRRTLEVLTHSALKRNKILDHALFHGQPGLGKTLLAELTANEMGSKIKYTQGTTLNNKADILALFGSISKGDTVFINGIDQLETQCLGMVTSAMTDGLMDIVIGSEGTTKIIRMKLPKFTLIGATSKIENITPEFKDLFGVVCKVSTYSDPEISEILRKSVSNSKYQASPEVIEILSSVSLGNPRLALNYLRRSADFADIENSKILSPEGTFKSLEILGVHKFGIKDEQLEYLKLLGDVPENSGLSLESISVLLSVSKKYVESTLEPILRNRDLIIKSSRGRKISNKGLEYLTNYNLVSFATQKEATR